MKLPESRQKNQLRGIHYILVCFTPCCQRRSREGHQNRHLECGAPHGNREVPDGPVEPAVHACLSMLHGTTELGHTPILRSSRYSSRQHCLGTLRGSRPSYHAPKLLTQTRTYCHALSVWIFRALSQNLNGWKQGCAYSASWRHSHAIT